MVDRCLLPVLTAHALAVILAFVLNTLRISQVSSWTLFFWFTSITLATLWFYHNLQVGVQGQRQVCECGMAVRIASSQTHAWMLCCLGHGCGEDRVGDRGGQPSWTGHRQAAG